MYDETVKALRVCEEGQHCDLCPKWDDKQNGGMNVCQTALLKEAADAIEELLRAAKSMHTWIFLNTGDEQEVYDECGLTDKMNAALGYGGQFVAEPPKEEKIS